MQHEPFKDQEGAPQSQSGRDWGPHSTSPVDDSTGPDVTMPLGVGDLSDESSDPFAGSGSGRKFRSSSLLIVIVLVLAGAGLFSMRKLARATATGGPVTEIEKTIDEFFKNITGGQSNSTSHEQIVVRHEEVLNVLSDDYSEKQIQLSDVYKDPFDLYENTTGRPVPIAAGPNTLESRRTQRKVGIETAGERFRIKSILMGSTPLANVDGTIVRVGDTIQVKEPAATFYVREISADAVRLEAHDEEFDLTIVTMLRLNPVR